MSDYVHTWHFHAHTKTHPHVCMYQQVCTDIYAYTHTYMCLSTHTNPHRHTHKCRWTYTCARVHAPSSWAKGEASWYAAIKPNKCGGRENGSWRIPVRRKEKKSSSKRSLTHSLEGTRWARITRPSSGATKEVSATVGACWLPHSTNPARLQMIKNELIWLGNCKCGRIAQFTDK